MYLLSTFASQAPPKPELDLQCEHDESDHAEPERGVAPDLTNDGAARRFYRHKVREP